MITFLGDVALTSTELVSDYKPTNPYIFNCEYVIGKEERLKPIPGKINICSPNHDFEKIFGSKPRAVSLANNHIYDFGMLGLKETINCMDDEGIATILDRPHLFNNIYIFAYMFIKGKTYGEESFFFEKEKFLNALEIANKKPDKKIIVMMHWGIENNPNPTNEQREIAHWLVDNGADMIIGHHPHCIQPIEIYSGKYIFYSIGNTLFPPINQYSHYDEYGKPTRKYRINWRHWNRTSYAITIDNDARIRSVELLYQNSNRLTKVRDVDIEKTLLSRHNNHLIYPLRKYWIFIRSNCLVDGHIFDFNAIKSEMTNK